MADLLARKKKGAKHNASSTMMQTQSAQAPDNRVLGNSCRPRTLTSKPQQSAAAHLTASSKGSRCNEEQKSWQATKQRLHNRIKEQIVSEDICSHDRAEGGGRGRKHRHRTSPRTPSGWLAGWNKTKSGKCVDTAVSCSTQRRPPAGQSNRKRTNRQFHVLGDCTRLNHRGLRNDRANELASRQ